MNRPGLKGVLRSTWDLLFAGARAWSADRAGRLGASLAYYSLFALVPLLALSVSLASFFFGREEVSQELHEAIADVLDERVADLVVTGIEQIQGDQAATYLPIVSLGLLVFTASLLFVAWRDVVSIIWDAPKEKGMKGLLRRRGFGLIAVIGAGTLLTIVMLTQALVRSLASLFDLDVIGVIWDVASIALPAATGAIFVGILLKYSPPAPVSWRSVWLSAIVTTTLLSLGAWCYGFYIDTVGLTSVAGVAGTAFLGLAVVYYAAQILLYGVEVARLSFLRVGR